MIQGDIYLSRNLKRSGTIMLFGILLGLVYPLLADDFGDIRAYTNGVLSGLILAIALAFFEFYVFNPNLKRFSFITLILLKSTMYLIVFVMIVVLVKAFVDSRYYDLGFFEYLMGEDFMHFLLKEDFYLIMIYTFAMLLVIIFTLQISRKMGPKMLRYFVTGRYHNPVEEDRIIMYLDLKSSTTIAEKLGDIQFHRLLYQFFFDITKCILVTEGEIYRYVGDEVIVSWKKKIGLRNANCIRTYLYAKDEIKTRREQYYLEFGIVPDFRAFFHSGKIVVGEIGEIKSQIVYHGTPMHELKQIEKRGTEWNEDLLLSGELMQQVSIPVIYTMKKAGEIAGKSGPDHLDVYTLRERVLRSY